METSKCCTCKEIKPVEAFHKDKNRLNGVHVKCKSCTSEYDKNRPKRVLTKEQKNRKNELKKLRRLAKNGGVKLPRGRKRVSEEHKLAVTRAWRKRYRKENKADLLASRLRNRMKKVLKYNLPSNKKTDYRSYYSSNVGCTGQELVKHIESQWTLGMSWENYGWGKNKWTIDHIRPISNFLKNGEDPRLANHYTNLAPLWFIDNMKKGSKF